VLEIHNFAPVVEARARPRAGDLEILLPFSGETLPVVIWTDVIKKFAGTIFTITGSKESTLAKKVDLKIILPREDETNAPKRFHTRAAYVLSPLPLKLAERLDKRGLNLPEYLINWYHS
jgi:D-arabinose 5-phosphate isomerase GutQ